MMMIVALFLSVRVWALDLDGAVRASLEKNEIVSQSREQLRQVEEQVAQVKSAVMPNLVLNGTYLMQPASTDPVAAAFFPARQTTVNFTLSQPLFRGFKEYAAINRENFLLDAQKQRRLSQMLQLYQQVTESFMEVLAFEQDVRNLEVQKEIYRGRIRDLQGRARRGESMANETLTAQATAAVLDGEIQIQSSKLRTARENFAFLTGLSNDVPLDDQPEAAQDVKLKPIDEYVAGVENRPDIRVAKEQLAASGEEIAIARAGHWPSADVVGNYYLLRPEGVTRDMKWDVQFRVSVPIFEGGLRQSQIRMAASRRTELELALAQMRRRSTAEVRSLFDSIRMRGDQLKYLKLASELAEKNHQVLLRDSKRGLIRSTEVQLGLTEYRNAKRTYDQARYQARLERIRLELASANIPSVISKDL